MERVNDTLDSVPRAKTDITGKDAGPSATVEGRVYVECTVATVKRVTMDTGTLNVIKDVCLRTVECVTAIQGHANGALLGHGESTATKPRLVCSSILTRAIANDVILDFGVTSARKIVVQYAGHWVATRTRVNVGDVRWVFGEIIVRRTVLMHVRITDVTRGQVRVSDAARVSGETSAITRVQITAVHVP